MLIAYHLVTGVHGYSEKIDLFTDTAAILN